MKFFIVLVILLHGEVSPKLFTYRFVEFTEIETCDVFLKSKKSQLKESVENQFPVETIHSSMMVCMTAQEINQINELKQDNKWQEQKHI
tara:strand:- start:407 stop:673 length:267 start_codon:yes stop_codon:yes gene_type:complete